MFSEKSNLARSSPLSFARFVCTSEKTCTWSIVICCCGRFWTHLASTTGLSANGCSLFLKYVKERCSKAVLWSARSLQTPTSKSLFTVLYDVSRFMSADKLDASVSRTRRPYWHLFSVASSVSNWLPCSDIFLQANEWASPNPSTSCKLRRPSSITRPEYAR